MRWGVWVGDAGGEVVPLEADDVEGVGVVVFVLEFKMTMSLSCG